MIYPTVGLSVNVPAGRLHRERRRLACVSAKPAPF